MEPHVERWLARDPDPETAAELRGLLARGEHEEVARRFAGRLSFGTAGLRAPMGAGPLGMNRLVVRQSCAGIAEHLLRVLPAARERGVLVGYDGRHRSRRFAEDAACVLATAGLPVRLFARELPTPVVGFWQQRTGAAASVVITASHNPPQYNGIKVYWTNGAQILPPEDARLAAAIALAAEDEIACTPLAALRATGAIVEVGPDAEAAYVAAVAALVAPPAGAPPPPRALGIAYTPLHGVGARLAEAALRAVGFARVHTVAGQREPDGAFPTVRFPNPEEPGAMDAVLRLADEAECALACANDPDADRLAVAVRQADGTMRALSGDELGILLGHHLMHQAPPQAVVASTIVSSRLLGRIARARGVDYFSTLTGFKWISNGAQARAQRGERLLFAYEEALGYSVSDLVWDKDGISALVVVADLAARLAAGGETLLDRLEAIYREHGLFVTGQRTLALNGAGAHVARKLRGAGVPELVAGRQVEAAYDLARGGGEALPGAHEPAVLPAADVLVYHLHGDARIIVRPSGTEPKIKCYYEVHVPIGAAEPIAAAEARAREDLLKMMDDHQRDLAIL